ncbi:helix-turn-helix transcriptional regulator [Streptomyces sp. NBC_01451]|uniref:helix-turn-helix transcriptional regulator n=1 Tax=Streptomyces sp. NBC_01451 TaxID=2903872 RepID=UPI002E37753E|nr:helix-turn-helix transcriptional regulator [Streptomyces sp. NBC_01451]
MRPHWGVAEIAQELGVGAAEVRTALGKLADLSMLGPADETDDVVAVHPEVGLASYIHRREVEIRAQQMELASMRAVTSDLAAVFAAQRTRHENAGLERLEGVSSVRNRLSELSRQATSELLAFMPGGSPGREALEASRPLDEKSLASGVTLRTVYLDGVRDDRATTEYARRLSELGGEIRTAPSLPLRMLIADRSAALLPIDPEDTRAGAVVVHAPGVLSALVSLFDMVWDRASPLGVRRANAAEDPTPQEVTLLKLLAQGQTDDVASRKLGLSLRTTRRLMAGITAKLGARSRFETAVLATRAGWL